MAGNDIVQIHSPQHRKGRRVIIGNLARGGQRSKQAIYIAYPLCPAMFSYLFLMYGKQLWLSGQSFLPPSLFLHCSAQYNIERPYKQTLPNIPYIFCLSFNEMLRGADLYWCQFKCDVNRGENGENKIAHFLLKKEYYYKPSQKIMSSILKTA